MKKSLVFLMVVVSTCSAFASECPVQGFDADKIQTAIESANSCYSASDIAQSCAFGSAIDVQFAGAAVTICEKEIKSITSAEKAVLDGLKSKCESKYENESGTMYRSAAAYCILNVSEGFASALSGVEGE